MKLYSRRRHRSVERQIHFGIGKSVKTACGLNLFSRHVMVSIICDNDGAIITDDLERVTCKRCLNMREIRLRKLLAVERENPGIFDHESLCSEQWLLEHGLDIRRGDINAQKLEVSDGKKSITLSSNFKPKERRFLLRNFLK